jgi:D-alanyl-D-alanine carboxypeptidase
VQRCTLVVLALAAALAGCGSGDEAPQEVARPEFKRHLDRLAAESHAAAIALVQTKRQLWRGAAGSAERGRKATPADRYSIASTTKTFVATVVLQLVDEERLSLTDELARWFPSLRGTRRAISIRHLLNHTSGLSDYGFISLRAETLARELNRSPLTAVPGREHRYANADYDVLAIVVQRVTGRDIAQEARDRILRPLELKDTGYGPVTPEREAAGRPAWLGVPDEGSGPAGGAGGIASTAGDVATFFRALLAGDLLPDDLLAEMTHTVPTDEPHVGAGLGLFRFELPCGVAYGHGGDQGSYSNMPLVAPDGSIVVVVAQNTNGWINAREVAEKLFCA